MPSTPAPTALVVQKGRLIAYRVFDVGDEIALEKVQAIAEGKRRLVLSREGAKSLVFAAPPLDVAIGSRQIALATAGEVEAHVSARLFDYGAVSISIEISIAAGTDLGTLLPLCDEIYESSVIDEAARRELDLLVPRLDGALEGAHTWRGSETYTVIFIEELLGRPSGAEVLAWPFLAKLIVGEPGEKGLAPEQTTDVLRHSHSYFEDDLTVIDWNSAFVLEPSGSRDIPDILEFATSQLLELRYYDDIFDRELGRIYDDLALARRAARSRFLRSPYVKLARNLVRRIVELTECTERVDNALKIIGDFYLARVYDSALKRFRIPVWRASIDGKQALVAQAYGLIKGEVDTRRSVVLELVVILLIALEIALALLRH